MTALPDFVDDVSIETAHVPATLDAATARGVLWQAAQGRFLLHVPGVARYLVKNGRAILIEVLSGAELQRVHYFLRMTPLAALLYQRDILVLHGASVSNALGDAVFIVGDSGTGKSTLLATLLQRGWTMHSDELAVVIFDEQGRAIVPPVYSEIALWPDSLTELNIDIDPLSPCDANRYKLSKTVQFASGSHPLRSIYCLSVCKGEFIEIDRVMGAECFSTLGNFSFNSHIANTLLDRTAFMKSAATIAQSIPILRLRRPRGVWCHEQLADIIEKGCS